MPKFKDIEEIISITPNRGGVSIYEISYVVDGLHYVHSFRAKDELDAVLKLKGWRQDRWEQLMRQGRY